MGYSADKTAYNSGINTDISTQTTPNSIPPEVVGAGYTDLADLLEPYINSINNQALLFGPTVPSNSLGVDLDLYFRQANPIEIYRKISGVWVLQGTLPLGFTLPEGNLTVRTSIDGFVVTATKGGWVISNTVYQKNTQTQLLVDPADLNFGRIDNIYANTSNNILYQVGIASVTPTAPILPANTILIDQVIVPASSSGNDPYLLFGGGSPSDGETNFGNSTGLITGGVLTINADPTKFNVSQGSALFVDYTTPIPPTPPTVVNFGPLSGLTVTNLGSAISSYIGIDGDAVIHQQITPFTPTQRRSIATLGILIHSNLTNINAINTQGSNILSPANQLHDFIEAIGPLNLSGNKYSNASTNLTIQKTAGSIFKFGCNSGDYTNPHQLSLSAGNPVTFRYRTRNGVETADTTNIIPGSYDNAGTITAVGTNQWTNQHITVFQSGLTRLQYGQNLYGSSAEALAASLTEAFAVEANIAANGIFRCILTIRGGASNLSITTDAIFSEVPKFGGSVGNAGSALTSANIIAALGYTPVDGPASSTDNAIARYDGTNGNVLQDSLVTILDDGNMISGSTGGNKLPTGTTAQRPSSLLDGYFRKNNDLTNRALEYYDLGSTTWRTILDSVNGIQNQSSIIQSGSFWIGGPAQIGGSTFSNIQPFEVVGTNAGPAGSGSSTNGSIRLRSSGINTISLDFGVNGTGNNSWIQSRNPSDYTIKSALGINPNGGAVSINGFSTTINSSSTFFPSVVPNLDITTGTSTSSFSEAVVIRHNSTGVAAVTRSLALILKLSSESDPAESSKMGGFLLESINTFSNSPSLFFITNNIKQASIFSNGNFIIQNGGTFTDAGFRFDVFGTSRFTGSDSAPASSGSAVASSIRLAATGNTGTVLRGGVDATNSYSWLQSSSGTDFSVQRELRLNPNGSFVSIIGGAECLRVGTNTGLSDNAFIGLYARSATPTTRTGYLGYITAASTELELKNEINNANLSLHSLGSTSEVLAKCVSFRIIPNSASSQNWQIVAGGSTLFNSNRLTLESSLTTFSGGNAFRSALYRGSNNSRTPILSGDIFMKLEGIGQSDALNASTGASIQFVASENWSISSIGSRISFSNILNGTISLIERFRIENTGAISILTSPQSATSTATVLYRETSGEIRQGALILPIRTITATATLTVADYTVLVDATSGNITVNLPTAASASGTIFNVKRIVTASNTITIDPSGAELIDGASTFNVPTLNQSVMFQSNGTAWFTL